MLSLLQELDIALRNGRPVCYTALVETRGSTPQKAGATMLVFADGSQVGTLGGGCVEAEVKRRALTLLASGSIELLSFQLDNDYGWDDGLICGGRMKMLVDPLRPGDDMSYYRALQDRLTAGRGATEAIVIDGEKADARDADRWLLDEQGAVVAERLVATKAPLTLALSPQSRGEGTGLPPKLLANLKPLDERPRPYIEAGVSYLPHLKRCRLIVVGAGHVGQKVAELSADVGFDVWVVDDRQEYCNSDRFPHAKRLIIDAFDVALRGLEIDSNTYCIIVTRGHNHDEQALLHLAETSARYVGMIGSRRKIKLIFDDLLREGVSADALARIYAPLGFDIGSQTVPEIAISIVAELVAHRNLGRLPDRVRPASVLDGRPT
ncbi:MAG: XdhC family protein [Candidatus Saccharimonas sp.]|nr:XdhC family protein [Planctomycetaceae bacterium]